MARPTAPLPHPPMHDPALWGAWDHGYALGRHDGWELGWTEHAAHLAAQHAAIARHFRATRLTPGAAELARRRGEHDRAAYLEALAIVRGYHPTAPSILQGPWPPLAHADHAHEHTDGAERGAA